MFSISASIVLYNDSKKQLIKVINSFLNTNLEVRLYLIDNSLNDDLKELKNIENLIINFHDSLSVQDHK